MTNLEYGYGDVIIKLYNELGEELVLALKSEEISLDRSNSGESSFHPEFGNVQKMPFRGSSIKDIELILDSSSIEVFINEGLYAMTAQVFNVMPFTKVVVGGSQEKKRFTSSVYDVPPMSSRRH